MVTARFNQRGAHLMGQEHVVRWLRSVGMSVARKKAKPMRRGDGEKRQGGHGEHIRMKWVYQQNRTLAFFAYELK
jgi:hypothetical protein